MIGAATHTVPVPPEEVASAVGHALNNVLPFLYAASSFLDGEDDPPDIERARRAIWINQTSDNGQEIVDRAVSVEDLFQTYCRALDIKADKELFTPESRPLKIVDGGKPVNELFA